MPRKSQEVAPLDLETVEFIQAPYDGPMAVEQRLRNLVEIAIDIQTRNGLLKNYQKTGTKSALS